MKRFFCPLLIALSAACGGIEEYDAPEYDAVSRVVTPQGKTFTIPFYCEFPPGAVSKNFIVMDPPKQKSVTHFLGETAADNVPPFILAQNEKFLKYDYLVAAGPLNTTFLKEITYGVLYKTPNADQFVFEYKTGTDSTKKENWIDRTSSLQKRNTNLYVDKSTNFKRYLITSGYYDNVFYLDKNPTFDVPYAGRRPILTNGKYRATVIDMNGETYLIYLNFINFPAAGKEYHLFDASVNGQLSNTNDQLMEIEAGFSCTSPVGGNPVNCSQRYVGKSGSVRYNIENLSDGTVQHRVLFKNVVIRRPTTGTERTLNGYYKLNLN